MRLILDHATLFWLRLRLNEAAPLVTLAAVSFFAWAFRRDRRRGGRGRNGQF
jgi:hypothetical protein